LISASADSISRIGNINNDKYYRLTGDNPFCFAQFTPADRGLIAIDYSRKGGSVIEKFYSMDSRNPDINGFIRNQYAISISAIKDFNYLPGFSYLLFSKEDNYFICAERNDYFLVDNRMIFEYERAGNFILLQLKGNKPFFTNDGKYIFSIEGRTFREYLIDLETILSRTKLLD
jgi:hypothetical protein